MDLKENLYTLLSNRFDKEEITQICLKVGLDVKDIQETEKTPRIWAIIRKAENHALLEKMISQALRERPESVPILYPKTAPSNPIYSLEQITQLIHDQPIFLTENEHLRREYVRLINALVEAGNISFSELTSLKKDEYNQQKAYLPFIDEIKQEKKESEKEHCTILFDEFQNFSLSAGTEHLIKDYGVLHTQFSTNILAASALCSALKSPEGNDWVDNVIITQNLLNIDTDRDIIAIGSPVSDFLSKVLLEYEGMGYGLNRKKKSLIQLPFEYIMNQELVDFSVAPARRFVAGVEKTMPNWRMKERGRFLPPPRLDNRGWIQTDYLLITKIPNILTRKAFLSGRQALIVGGTHGVGTYAIRNLLSRADILAELWKNIYDKPYYQILIPIPEIEHKILETENGITLLSHAVELGRPIVRQIDIDDEKILKKI